MSIEAALATPNGGSARVLSDLLGHARWYRRSMQRDADRRLVAGCSRRARRPDVRLTTSLPGRWRPGPTSHRTRWMRQIRALSWSNSYV